MVNFGYNKQCNGWKEERKYELAKRFKELLLDLGYCTDVNDPNRMGFTPYLEVDGMDGGVRIRAITHLSSEEEENLVLMAEEIYTEVMDS